MQRCRESPIARAPAVAHPACNRDDLNLISHLHFKNKNPWAHGHLFSLLHFFVFLLGLDLGGRGAGTPALPPSRDLAVGVQGRLHLGPILGSG